MSSRPRRSAATKANEVISVHARWADSPERSEISDRGTMSSRRSGRASGVTRDAPSSPGDSHLNLTVKVPANKLREVTRGNSRRSDQFVGGEIVEGKRNRGAKKSYVVDSSPDEDDDEEEEDEIQVEEEDDDDDDMDELDEDAEGEDEMEVDADGDDVDAEGEEDAEGDIDMDIETPTIRVIHPGSRSKPAPRPSASKVIPDDDDDDDELSDPADSDLEDQTLGLGDETMADEDAEGEEIEVAGEEVDVEDEEVDSDDEDGSQDESPDLTKMTRRQRARFEDLPTEHMKLSDGEAAPPTPQSALTNFYHRGPSQETLHG